MTKTKTEIFNKIVDIMSRDYSGCHDKKAHNQPEKYEIKDEMSDEDFVKTVQSYLMDFQDHHVLLRPKSNKTVSNGFCVRRYENKLYVTETIQENELMVGDAISSIDNMDIAIMAGLHKKELFDDIYERQIWGNVLNNAQKCTIQRDGNVFEFTLKRYSPAAVHPVYSFEKVNDTTCLLTLSDFANESAINSLISTNHEAIISSSNLLIDVRKNDGGSDMSYYQLLSYIFPEKMMFSDLFTDDDSILMNCTEFNCDLRTAYFSNYLQKGLDDFTSRWIKQELLFYKENYGKGFVTHDDEIDFEINGKSTPANIFILSDCYCKSSGDAFVQTSKKSSKVKVIGRNTMGITDYSNGAIIDFGDYQFIYPTTKIKKNHINGIGVAVDVYIPWTPEHLVKDVDLERALSMT
jgi:C-terminal processing protease CtpA/Prc